MNNKFDTYYRITPLLLIIISIILFIFLSIGFIKSTIKAKNEIEQVTEEYKSHIGNEFVIGKDTLMIVDYSIWNENYTLDNGLKVNAKLINKKNGKL